MGRMVRPRTRPPCSSMPSTGVFFSQAAFIRSLMVRFRLRSAGAYAFRSLLDAGARLAFGSDCPVETMNVIAGIHAAVTRRRADGEPAGGWYPEQRLSVEEAVKAYTLGAAYAAGQEAVLGTLVAGKLGDVVVLSRDLFTLADPMDILTAQVDLTVLGGQVVYEREAV